MKKNDYLDSLKEWQEKQYSPGEYIGRPWPFKFFDKKKTNWKDSLGIFLITALSGILIILFVKDEMAQVLGWTFLVLGTIFSFLVLINKKNTK